MKITGSNWQWDVVKASVLVFPLMAELGGLGLLIVAINICWQKHRSIIQYPLNWVLGVFCLWLIVSSYLAEYPQEAWLGLANFIPFFLLFISLTQLIKTSSQLRELSWRFFIGAIPVIWLGFVQLFAGWEVPKSLNFMIGWTLTPYGNPTGRMSSVFMYANLLGLYLLIIFILGLGLWCDTYYLWRRKKRAQQAVILAGITLILIADSLGLILTNSRNSWGLALFACLAFSLYLGWQWLVEIIAVMGVIISGAAWGPYPIKEWLRSIVPIFFWARLSDQLYPDRPLATLRITQWKFIINMLQERPLTGWGLRNFTPLYKAEMGLWLGHPHNLFLMLLGEVGIIGAALLWSLVGWILFQAIQIMRVDNQPQNVNTKRDNLILFSYIVAFSACSLFNCFDVTLLDGKSNTIGWLILTVISGIVYHNYREKSIDIAEDQQFLTKSSS